MPDSRPVKTIDDVARIAGVSKKTVSRVLNNSDLVSDATRILIVNTMRDLGFVPDRLARGLAARRSYLIGLVYDNPNALYIAEIQQGVLDICRDAGYELVVHPANYQSPDLVDDVSGFVRRLKLDGIALLSPISQNQSLVDQLAQLDCRVARLCAIAEPSDPSRVVSLDRLGAIAVAKHLYEYGHREIGLVTGPNDFWSAQERQCGFEEALATYGLVLKPDQIAFGDFSVASGFQCAQTLLETSPNLTAIFASNDAMAAGVYRAAHVRGLRIPEDLSVIGFDDSILATALSPSLTSVNQAVRELGRTAAAILVSMINQDPTITTKPSSMIHPKLIIRESVIRRAKT